MRAIWIVTRNDIARRLRSPLASIVYLLFPFLFSGLMALAFGGTAGGGGMPRFKVALVNEDGGMASRLLVGAFNQEQMSQYFDATEVSAEEAQRLIRKDKVGAALVIPEGFTDDLLDGRPTTLRVIKNPAASIAPMAAEEMARTMAELLDGAVRVLDQPLELLRATGQEILDRSEREGAGSFSEHLAADVQVAQIAVAVNRSLRSIEGLVFPPVISLESTQDSLLTLERREELAQAAAHAAAQTTTAESAVAAGGDPTGTTGTAGAGAAGSDPTETGVAGSDAAGGDVSEAGAATDQDDDADDDDDDDDANAGFYLVFKMVLPGMASFALAILALGFMADIPRERAMGTLQRQMTFPVPTTSIVWGKMLSTILMGLIVAAAMGLIGALLLKARADLLGFALLCITFLGAATGLFSLVYGIARSEQQGSTLASMLVMIMAFLGGSWIPLNMLPGFVRGLAPATINYWSLEGFQTLLFTDGGVEAIATPLLVLAAIAVVSATLGGWLLQRRVMQGS